MINKLDVDSYSRFLILSDGSFPEYFLHLTYLRNCTENRVCFSQYFFVYNYGGVEGQVDIRI